MLKLNCACSAGCFWAHHRVLDVFGADCGLAWDLASHRPSLISIHFSWFLFSAFVNCAPASKSLVGTLTYVVPGRLMMSNLHTPACELHSVIFFRCIGELAQYMRLARLLFLLSFLCSLSLFLSFSLSLLLPFPPFFFSCFFFLFLSFSVLFHENAARATTCSSSERVSERELAESDDNTRRGRSDGGPLRGRRSNKNMVKARTLAQARSEDQLCCQAWRAQFAKM